MKIQKNIQEKFANKANLNYQYVYLVFPTMILKP